MFRTKWFFMAPSIFKRTTPFNRGAVREILIKTCFVRNGFVVGSNWKNCVVNVGSGIGLIKFWID